MNLYPLKFEKVLKEKVWGGENLKKSLNIDLPVNKKIGESWEVTCHSNGMSYVENGNLKGQSLENLIKIYKEKLLGSKNYEKYENKFPLLIKYLDINDKLSVQVHPNDEYALKVEGEFGKAEVWYVIDASEDAKLILGLKEELTKEEFLEKTKNNDFNDIFNIVPVKIGDFINVETGLVHASLEGSVLICEIQQNSDTTYRIYDFDRLVDGEYRPLHLEKAIDVIDFDKKFILEDSAKRIRKKQYDAIIENLIEGEYFSLDRICLEGTYIEKSEDTFKIFSIIDGKGKMTYDNEIYPMKKGDTYLIPSNLEVKVEGKLEILKTWI